jgi:hypothetical protein
MKKLLKTIKLKKIAKKNGINFNSRLGLSINGCLVSDFGYLLEWYSNGLMDSFQDRHKLTENRDLILSEIDHDFEQTKLKEELSYYLSKATAVGNLLNFRNIVISITQYYESEIKIAD